VVGFDLAWRQAEIEGDRSRAGASRLSADPAQWRIGALGAFLLALVTAHGETATS